MRCSTCLIYYTPIYLVGLFGALLAFLGMFLMLTPFFTAETSPHVIDRIIEAIDAIRMAVGPGVVMNYVWAGLFHPARKVRVPYFRSAPSISYIENTETC